MSYSHSSWDIKKIGWGGFIKKLYFHHKPSGGILLIRLVIGLLMLAAGWWKVTHIDMALGFFQEMGFSAFEGYLVSWVELVGGILLILGIFTKPVSVAFAIEMAVIVWGTAASPSIIYWGHDYNFVLLVIFLGLYLMGPGRYSLSYLWLKKMHKGKEKLVCECNCGCDCHD